MMSAKIQFFADFWRIYRAINSAIPDNVECPFQLLFHGESGIEPMDGEAAPLHAPEPGHLSLGKLMYRNLKL